MTESPFTVEVYDQAFVRRGWVGDPVELAVTVRHNARGTASLTVTADHPRLTDLTAPGARLVIRYDGRFLMSGRVRLRSGQGPALAGQVTLAVVDDLRVLWEALGWPVPTAGITQQGTAAYDTRTGPAESVLKAYVSANLVGRLGRPLTVAPDLGRGATITASLRMHPLADRLLPMVDAAGIGVTVRQEGAGLLLDCYTPSLHPRTLSEQSGVVQSWSWSSADPEATRVVGGGQGEGTLRTFRQIVDVARESEWADVVEVFRDARDAATTALLDERVQEALAEGAPTAGLSVSLAETATFRYGRAVTRGDRVRMDVGPGVVVEDVLREATLGLTRVDGLTVTPVIGQRSDDPSMTLARAVGALGRAVRDLKAGR